MGLVRYACSQKILNCAKQIVNQWGDAVITKQRFLETRSLLGKSSVSLDWEKMVIVEKMYDIEQFTLLRSDKEPMFFIDENGAFLAFLHAFLHHRTGKFSMR